MNKPIFPLIMALSVFGFCSCAYGNTEASFISKDGFMVHYPEKWLDAGSSNSILTLRSPRNSIVTPIEEEGTATITVAEARYSPERSLEQITSFYLQDGVILSKRVIPLTHKKGACSSLEEIVWKEPAVPPDAVPVPPPNAIYTSYFCQIGEHKYAVIVRNLEHVHSQDVFQHVALEIVMSLRVNK